MYRQTLDLAKSPSKKQIRQCKKEVKKQREVTLHPAGANAMKVIQQLQLLGIIELTDENYQILYATYTTDVNSLTEESINSLFVSTLDNATFKRPENLKLRLMNLFAGHGQNDLYMLCILNALEQHQINYVVLMSKGDAIFWQNFELLKRARFQPLPQVSNDTYRSDHYSLYAFNQLIARDVINASQWYAIFQCCYLPKSRLFDYNLLKVSDTASQVNLFCYGRMPISALIEIAQFFQLRAKDVFQRPESTALVIKKINQQYNSVVVRNCELPFQSELAFQELLGTYQQQRASLEPENLAYNITYGCSVDSHNENDEHYTLIDEGHGDIVEMDSRMRAPLPPDSPQRQMSPKYNAIVVFSPRKDTRRLGSLSPQSDAVIGNQRANTCFTMGKVINKMGVRAAHSRKQRIMIGLQRYTEAHHSELSSDQIQGLLFLFFEAAFTPRMFLPFFRLLGTTASGKKVIDILTDGAYLNLTQLLGIRTKLNRKNISTYIAENTESNFKKKQLYEFWGFTHSKKATIELTDEAIEERLNRHRFA